MNTTASTNIESSQDEGDSINSNLIYSQELDAILKDYQQFFEVIFTMFPIILWVFFVNRISMKLQIQNLLKLFLIEYLTLLIILIFNTTILNKYIIFVNLFIIIVFVLIIKNELQRKSNNTKINDSNSSKITNNIKNNNDDADNGVLTIITFHKNLDSFTLSKSSINLFTSACILAVDFNIFPIHFGKSRTYGMGLMDTGIGLFIFSTGIVWKDKLLHSNSAYENFKKLIKECGILCSLGIIRVIVLKLLNFHQDVTEYGRHWNAFLTIGITRLIGNYLAHKVDRKYHLFAAVLILGLYDLILQLGLTEFIFNAETGRDTFITANREGIFSTIGFVSLYLFSVHVGQKAIRSLNYERKYLSDKQFQLNRNMLIEYSIFLWIIVFTVCIPILGVSRRICNSGYILWILAIGTSMLSLFMIYERYIKKKTLLKGDEKSFVVPLIIKSVNYNGLTTFLLSNILTGLVNKIINTNKSSTIEALCILSIYIFVTLSIICLLYLKRIRIA